MCKEALTRGSVHHGVLQLGKDRRLSDPGERGVVGIEVTLAGLEVVVLVLFKSRGVGVGVLRGGCC